MTDASVIAFDAALVEREATRYRLIVPRTAVTGRHGHVLGRRAGGSLELHDFREYQPGDDVRQVDWNAAARTDQLVVRVRREEVSPRVEVLLDLSRSMAVTPRKAECAQALARLFVRIASLQGLDPVLVTAGRRIERLRTSQTDMREASFDGELPLPLLLHREPALRPCGLRLVVSDFLFDVPLDAFCARLADGASQLALVQVLDPEDESPSAASTSALIDSETGERLERELTERVVATYRRRFAAHQSALEAASRRASALRVQVNAGEPFDRVLRRRLLGHVLEARA